MESNNNGDKQPVFGGQPQQQLPDKASVSKLNIIRAQVFFLLSTLSEDKWDSTVQQLREVMKKSTYKSTTKLLLV